MLKELNNKIAQLYKGVDDDTLEVIEDFYQAIDVESLNTYEALAYYEMDRLLWDAWSVAYEH